MLDSKGEEIYSMQTDSSGIASVSLDLTLGTIYLKVKLTNVSTVTSRYNMISWLGSWNDFEN